MLDLIKINNKELLVRKQIAGFIEKIFNFLGYRIDHDSIKKVLYGEESYKNKDEEKAKCAYDAYLYLLKNNKSPLTNRTLNTFFYIYFGCEIDPNVSIRLVTRYFNLSESSPIERALEFHFISFNEMDSIKEEDKFIVSFMFLNYVLVKNNIPTIRLLPNDFSNYINLRKNKGNNTDFYSLILTIINRNNFQDKTYYKNLKEVSLIDIYETIINDKDYIKEKFKIKHISVFGSFAKGINRIDSDIDLLVSFSLDLTSEDKNKLVNEFKDYYLDKFNRFIDVSEISEYLNDEFIKNIPYVKKIF